MRIIITENYEEMSQLAAETVAEELKAKPNIVLGLATGSTPIGMYEELIQMVHKGDLTFRDVTTFNLDEYIGLETDHPQSYHYFMKDTLFSKIDIQLENTFLPYIEPYTNDRDQSESEHIENACNAYDQLITNKGGIDLQILGIGSNGHIGFNEPGPFLQADTHVAPLTMETREANARFFDHIDEVPTHSITMGVGSILKAKKIILLANGKGKADAVAQLLSGKISTEHPASLLQTHRDVTIIIDREAAAKLK